MQYFSQAMEGALRLILEFDPAVFIIVKTSLSISFMATLIAGSMGIILGILLAINDFTGKQFLQQILHTLMAMPTVMIGLIFYGLLSRQGPLGALGLLYTETAVVIGEACLILPIITNLTLVGVQNADQRLIMTLRSFGANNVQMISSIISELRLVLLAGIITGFGRAIGEVGAAMMLGGNIQGATRTMTTAIAMETSKGDFELGLALGILLLFIAFSVNILLQFLHHRF